MKSSASESGLKLVFGGINFFQVINLRHYLYSDELLIWRILNGNHKRLAAEVSHG